MEREFWIAVMKAQKELGIKIEKKSIDQSEKVKGLIDLDSIREREVVTKHDVKAGWRNSPSWPGISMHTRV